MRFSSSITLSALGLVGLLSLISFGQSAPMLPSKVSPKIEPKKEICRLTLATLPPVARLQMGISYEEALVIYPEMADDKHFQKSLETEGRGLTKIRSSTLFDEPANDKSFEVALFFKDRVLVVISDETGTSRYKTRQEAVADYSRILGIEESLWRLYYDTGAELECVDFAFFINSVGTDGPDKYTTFNIHSPPPSRVDPPRPNQ